MLVEVREIQMPIKSSLEYFYPWFFYKHLEYLSLWAGSILMQIIMEESARNVSVTEFQRFFHLEFFLPCSETENEIPWSFLPLSEFPLALPTPRMVELKYISLFSLGSVGLKSLGSVGLKSLGSVELKWNHSQFFLGNVELKSLGSLELSETIPSFPWEVWN